MATQYMAAYATSKSVGGTGIGKTYAQAASSGDSTTTGMLLAYDGTLTSAQLSECWRAIRDMLGLAH